MKSSCIHESEIVGHQDQLTPDLLRHIETCEVCSFVVEVDLAMSRMARSVPGRGLPSPAVLWLKAQLLGIGTGVEIVDRPMSLAQRLAWVVTGGAWVFLAFWQWPRVRAWISTIDFDHIATGTIASFPLSPSLMWVFVFLLSITFTLMMQTAIQQD